MRAALARAAMALAGACLGDARREWALAMRCEFEAAAAEGKPLSFALGCLAAAWRDLPAHGEGRFRIASHFVALVLLVPTAALLAASVLADFPGSYLGAAAFGLGAADGGKPLLNEATRLAVPSLAILLIALAAAHLRIAWLVLDRDWARVAVLAALTLAGTLTLLIFASLVFASFAWPLVQLAGLAAELAGILILARWHARAFDGSPEASG